MKIYRLFCLCIILALTIASNPAFGSGFAIPDQSAKAVAMGNAPDEVKAVADYITLDVDHSGVATAVNRFLL